MFRVRSRKLFICINSQPRAETPSLVSLCISLSMSRAQEMAASIETMIKSLDVEGVRAMIAQGHRVSAETILIAGNAVTRAAGTPVPAFDFGCGSGSCANSTAAGNSCDGGACVVSGL